MSSENWREEYRRKNARLAKIFGVFAAILLTAGISLYDENTISPAIVLLTILIFAGAALSFFGMIVSLFFMSTDNC